MARRRRSGTRTSSTSRTRSTARSSILSGRSNDDFHDFFEIRGQLWRDANGEPVRALEHVHHVSNDVNSVTGFTLHEHNHFVVLLDFVHGTVTLNGAINIMQRPGAGSVILNAGHKVFDLETGTPFVLAGPDRADDEDFCRAVAP